MRITTLSPELWESSFEQYNPPLPVHCDTLIFRGCAHKAISVLIILL